MKLITASLLSALLVSGVAVANPLEKSTQSSAPPFEQIDKNKDGALSKSEAKQAPGLDFSKADVNRDGKLSRAEYETAAMSTGGTGG